MIKFAIGVVVLSVLSAHALDSLADYHGGDEISSFSDGEESSPTTSRVTDLSSGKTGRLVYPMQYEEFDGRGTLSVPEGSTGKVPAMIIVHGSGGLGYRERSWESFLRRHGFATMVIDYFGPRGVTKNSRFQPVPALDVMAALKILATHPQIDPQRIGAIGFSRGGNMVIKTANMDATWVGHTLAAHVALYAPCVTIALTSSGRSGAPILILIGSKDSYSDVRTCVAEVDMAKKQDNRDVNLKIYEGAYHGWDGDYSGIWYHPALKKSFEFREDAEVTKQSRQDVLEFLNMVLKPSG